MHGFGLNDGPDPRRDPKIDISRTTLISSPPIEIDKYDYVLETATRLEHARH